MDSIFAPLRNAIMAREYQYADLFECIGGFSAAPHQGFIGAALAMHTRDILREDTEVALDCNAVLAEAYRRTFFDETHALKYGTEMLAQQEPATLRTFANYVADSLQMDDIQHRSGFPTSTPATPQ